MNDEYKARIIEIHVVYVDLNHASQECSRCRHIVKTHKNFNCHCGKLIMLMLHST